MQKPKKAPKKAPVVKKKTQSIIITKKGPAKSPAKPVKAAPAAKKALKAGAAKHAASKPLAGKPPVGKPTQSKPVAKVDLKKKVAAPVAATVKTVVSAGKAPIKPGAARKPEAAPAKVEKKEAVVAKGPKIEPETKPELKSETKASEAKSKKASEEVERVVEAAQPEEEVILTDAEGRRYCRVKDCDQAATVDGGYCRFHYLLFWKNIQSRRKILSEGKLDRYIEELTARYPDKYLELLRKDLRSEKDFLAAIQELEIDDSGVDNEFEDEAQSYLDEVRGMSTESSSEREEEF